MTKFYFMFFLCLSCATDKTPELPNLNAESFSYEGMMQKQKELKQKAMAIKKENAELD
ncbi:MAG: hypothetical protein LBB12_00140 [Holosporaceae bacterium]|nr:hypothetical protein [Holosporaceae bacterium]